MLAGLHYVGFIPVSDTSAARRFYGDVLGLPVVDDSPFAVVVDAHGTQVRLTVVPHLTPQPFTVAGWATADIDATVAALAGAGVDFIRYEGMEQDDLGIWTAPGGDRVAWFRDPFDNTLSISTAGLATSISPGG